MRQVLVLNAGIITYDGADVDERTIFSCLNRAYNDSKTRRNGKIVNYNGATGKNLRESMEIINEIRNCIVMDCEGFSLRYQPIVSNANENIVAAEALLCWRNDSAKFRRKIMFLFWREIFCLRNLDIGFLNRQ